MNITEQKESSSCNNHRKCKGCSKSKSHNNVYIHVSYHVINAIHVYPITVSNIPTLVWEPIVFSD